MHVHIVLKSRFLELGAKEFFPYAEADEADGIDEIDEIIDAWMDKLLPAVRTAVKPEETQGTKEPNDVLPLHSCSIKI